MCAWDLLWKFYFCLCKWCLSGLGSRCFGVVQPFMNWSQWGLILILAFRVSLTHWIKLKILTILIKFCCLWTMLHCVNCYFTLSALWISIHIYSCQLYYAWMQRKKQRYNKDVVHGPCWLTLVYGFMEDKTVQEVALTVLWAEQSPFMPSNVLGPVHFACIGTAILVKLGLFVCLDQDLCYEVTKVFLGGRLRFFEHCCSCFSLCTVSCGQSKCKMDEGYYFDLWHYSYNMSDCKWFYSIRASAIHFSIHNNCLQFSLTRYIYSHANILFNFDILIAK